MAQTLQSLGGIILNALPTVFLLIVLHFYLKVMLFRPLDKMLKQRHDLTEGARKTAEASLAEADRKSSEYEAKLREARAVVYKEQEETRKRWLEDQVAQLAQAQARSEAAVKAARAALAGDAAAAKQELAQSSTVLADQIATAVLARRVR
jgi:F-type H+-transporting ATPase subunit b